ncbi:MAG: alpha/beta fold hydrolase [Ilumatobacter sp.]|nr:alpha/beta fold hydrolase [Ilumatobacter sp.]
MDQRNAGRSSGPVSGDHGWHTYRDDQLALLDHLGVDRCHLVGMCIGGPYIINLLRAQPERFASAVLLQPVGIDDNRQEFYDLFDLWAEELAPNFFRDVTADEWHSFRSNMWDGEFVLTATPDEVAAIETPMLIAMGNDVYHPEATSRRIAELAPNARLIEEWKEGEALLAIDHAIHDFLAAHTA